MLGSVPIGQRYAHFAFSGHLDIRAAMEAIDQAVVGLPGWAAEPTAGADAGFRSWRHQPSGVELLMVVAGFQPLLLSVGQRSDDPAVQSAGSPENVAAVGRTLRGQRTGLAQDQNHGIPDGDQVGRHGLAQAPFAVTGAALRAVAAAVAHLGGRPVRDADLLPLARRAQERFEWWVKAEHRVEVLTPYLTHRRCPACNGWSKQDARWCRDCQREFTPQDNFRDDDARTNAEREIAALTAEGVRVVEGGPPPAPAGHDGWPHG